MAVDAGAQLRLRVIEMKGQDLPQANQPGDLRKSSFPAFGSADVITGREKMRCVETNSEAIGLVDMIENSCQMSDSVAEATPLTRRVFQGDSHRRLLRGGQHFVEAGNDLSQPGLFPATQVRARVQHQKRYFQQRGELDLLNERTNGNAAIF